MCISELKHSIVTSARMVSQRSPWRSGDKHGDFIPPPKILQKNPPHDQSSPNLASSSLHPSQSSFPHQFVQDPKPKLSQVGGSARCGGSAPRFGGSRFWGLLGLEDPALQVLWPLDGGRGKIKAGLIKHEHGV
jgi:hypothetical protein